jgi:DNA-binding GntR family transcriptional regulator
MITMVKQDIYKAIKKQILEEKLLPGQCLVERGLCETYGLSRTPIREILWKLCADGLLYQESNRGFTVRRLSLDQILEVFQMREAVEGMAARLACSKGDETFHSAICEIKSKLEKVNIEKDVTGAIQLGRNLHIAIIETAGNVLMSETCERLNNLTILTSLITRKWPPIERASREAHVRIIDSLLARDDVGSEQAMRDHLRETCRNLVEQFYPGMLNGSLRKEA